LDEIVDRQLKVYIDRERLDGQQEVRYHCTKPIPRYFHLKYIPALLVLKLNQDV
jgi:hypothetical protein